MAFLIAVIIAQATTNPYMDGPAIYTQECMSCHGDQGQGSSGVRNLSGNGGVTGRPERVISIVKHGSGTMPAFAGKLSDVEIAAVVTYIRTAWGNEGSAVSVDQVDKVH